MNLKKRQLLISVLLLFTFLFAYSFKCPDALDLIRYYELIEYNSQTNSIIDIIQLYFFTHIDFIYFTLLAIFHKTDLGMPVLTALVVSIYYIILLGFSRNQESKFNFYKFFIIIGIFCFPYFLGVLTISRNATAIIFLYIGIIYFFNQRIKTTLLFFLFATFTHISSLIYIVLFYACIFAYRLTATKGEKIINFICLILPSFYFIFLKIYNLLFSKTIYLIMGDSRYSDAYGGELLNTTAFSTLGYADKFPMANMIISSYILLNIDKAFTIKKLFLIVMTFFLIGFWGVSQMFTQRFLIVLPIFYVMYFFEIYNSAKNSINPLKKQRVFILLFILSCTSTLSFIIFAYGYRIWTLV